MVLSCDVVYFLNVYFYFVHIGIIVEPALPAVYLASRKKDKFPIIFSGELNVYIILAIINDPDATILFTHDTDNINDGINVSAYKTLESMREKVNAQMSLEEKLRAVDLSDMARIIIDKHFIKDIKGNLRRFGTQEFRCVKCNERYKRIPLIGKCIKCHGNIVLTSSEGNIRKYLLLSLEIADKYNVSSYLKNELTLLKSEIDAIFGAAVATAKKTALNSEVNKQTSLATLMA